MYSYILRRLIFGAITVLGVSVLVFLITRVMPGDPLVAIFGPDGMTKLTDEQRAHYMSELGLSDPLVVQYFRWLGDIAVGDFGRSFFRAESVGEMVARRGPLTAQIALLSVVFSWVIGIPVAIISAVRPNSIADNVVRVLSITLLAVPGFWLGMLMVLALLFWFDYRARPSPAPTCSATRGPPCKWSSGPLSCSASARPPTSHAWRAPACWR